MSETSKYSYFEEKILEYVDNGKDKYAYDMMVDLPLEFTPVFYPEPCTLKSAICEIHLLSCEIHQILYVDFRVNLPSHLPLIFSHFLSNQL